jgi:hypothetical protein
MPDGVDYDLTLRSQPLVLPDVVRIQVTNTAGDTLLESHGPHTGVEVFEPGVSAS